MLKKIFQLIMGQPQGFVSEADRFLQEFAHKNPELSTSQRAEVAKSQRIASLRDGTSRETVNKYWSDF